MSINLKFSIINDFNKQDFIILKILKLSLTLIMSLKFREFFKRRKNV